MHTYIALKVYRGTFNCMWSNLVSCMVQARSLTSLLVKVALTSLKRTGSRDDVNIIFREQAQYTLPTENYRT